MNGLLRLALLIVLVIAPGVYGAGLCGNAARATPEARFLSRVESDLRPYFARLPEKEALRLAREIETKLHIQKLNERRFLALANRYYRALNGGRLGEIFLNLNPARLTRNLREASAFRGELSRLARETGLPLHDSGFRNAFFRLRERWSNSAAIRVIAVNAVTQWVTYNMTGSFFPLPAFFPGDAHIRRGQVGYATIIGAVVDRYARSMTAMTLATLLALSMAAPEKAQALMSSLDPIQGYIEKKVSEEILTDTGQPSAGEGHERRRKLASEIDQLYEEFRREKSRH